MLRPLVLAGFALLPALPALGQTLLGTTFTYQGRLTDAGGPANGIYDLQLVLWSAAAGGVQVGPTLTLDDVVVTDGLFTVTLDFGAAAFAGNARWLEIGVRPGASVGPFTTLAPRQELTATPNALYSRTAGTAVTAGTATTAGNVTGIVGVLNGGTGANLGGSGGPGRYVKQTTVGGALSVGLITAPDLPAHTHSAAEVVSGTLPVARGGTGQTAYAVNGVVFASGAGNLAATTGGASGQVLVATSGAPPSWSTSTAITSVGTLGSLNVSGTATLGGLSCAGCVATAAIQNAAVTTPKVNPTVLTAEGPAPNLGFDTTPADNARVCAVAGHTASTNQRALLDAGIAWSFLSTVTGSPQVVYSTNGGATWTAVFAQPSWSSNPTNAWASSSLSGALSLNAGGTYLFAVTGWGSFAFTAIDSRCFLRVVVVAR